MKKRIVFAAALTMLLCGCGQTEGSQSESESRPAETTTVSAAETTDESASETVTAQTTVQTAAEETSLPETSSVVSGELSAANPWFSPAVYGLYNNGSLELYYIFYDMESGRTADPQTGMGIGFSCEQGKDEVVFHFGTVDDNSVMKMSRENGSTVGQMNGETYTFMTAEGLDPDTFSIDESVPDMPSPGSDLFSGYFTDENDSSLSMAIDLGTDSLYTVTITKKLNDQSFTEWYFRGEFDGRQVLHYNNCLKHTITVNTDGSITTEDLYTDGTGYIRIAEEGTKTGYTWSDDKEDAGGGAYFIME